MNEWITDRKPEPADAPYEKVWVMLKGRMYLTHYTNTILSDAWQPLITPEPYVKPKRYVVFEHDREVYGVMNSHDGKVTSKCIPTREAAERIAAIYDEVMP